MKYGVGLVEYRKVVHAWVRELPGCVTGGRDLANVSAVLPGAIEEFEGWLASHAEAIPPRDGWEIAESVDCRSPGAAADFLFGWERAPLSPGELESGLRWMTFSRDDLALAVASLPAGALDWAPPAITVDSFDEWAPEVRTARRILEHVLQFEVYYVGGLQDGLSSGIFDSVGDAETERARTIERLRSLRATETSRVYRPLRPGVTLHEEWTLAKVIRRIISHDRAHVGEIQERRSMYDIASR